VSDLGFAQEIVPLGLNSFLFSTYTAFFFSTLFFLLFFSYVALGKSLSFEIRKIENNFMDTLLFQIHVYLVFLLSGDGVDSTLNALDAWEPWSVPHGW